MTLQQGLNGYAGTADTYLDSTKPSTARSSASALQEQSGRYVVLVHFAAFASQGGPVPDGATIHSASLALYKSSAYQHSYALHRLCVASGDSGRVRPVEV